MSYRSSRGDGIAPVLAIIVVCFLVYIATIVADILGHGFLSFLALQRATFMQMPWTIVTSLFAHAGIWHLLFNMLTLYFFGTFLIRLVGTRTFLIIYFIGGIVGNIFCLLLTRYPVVGASGAIFALGGMLAVMMPRLRVVVFPIPIPMPIWVAVIGGFLIMSFVPGIAWQGHLGGLVCGLIAGFILRNRVRTPS
jgi:membrane associated rhomboid family serine protease